MMKVLLALALVPLLTSSDELLVNAATDCIAIGENTLCLSFDAWTWSCQATWNRVPCAACAVCGDDSEQAMAFSCELAARSDARAPCPDECINIDCEQGCLGCLIGTSEEEEEEEGATTDPPVSEPTPENPATPEPTPPEPTPAPTLTTPEPTFPHSTSAPQPQEEGLEEANSTDAASSTLVFDPAISDPEWPGVLPPAESTYGFIINFRYDDYATETTWILEQFVGEIDFNYNDSTSISRSSSSSINSNTSLINGMTGEWMEVDAFNGTYAESGKLDSYRQFRSPQSLYHLYIMDDFSDGMCCDYGEGWITVTNRSGVLWNMPGDRFTDIAEVYIWMHSDGATEIVDILESSRLNPRVSQEILANVTFLPEYTIQTINQSGIVTPQEEALFWLMDHPKYHAIPDWRKQQLFGLATFLYATKTSQWLNTTVSECQWRLNSLNDRQDNCDSTGGILKLDVDDPDGPIPPEISLISSLKDIDMAVANLESTLPTELFLLTNLTRIWISHNDLTGTLPTQLGMLTNLDTLVLRDNFLSGSIPSEIGLLTDLRYVTLDQNQLTGKITTEVCEAPLYTLVVDCLEISCPCPSCKCECC